MQVIKQGMLALSLIGISLPALGFYCSTQQGNGFINIGSTIDQVRQACGSPTAEKVEQQTAGNKIDTIQYWMYENAEVVMNQPLSVEGPYRSVKRNGPPTVFQVTNNKVTAITQGNNNVNQTNQCMSSQPGSPQQTSSQGEVRIGDSVDKIIAACGQPSFVNTTNETKAEEQAPREVTVWSYDLGPYSPALVLQFEDAKLISINGNTNPQ